MIRKDWLERLIEQLAAVVRKAFGLAQQGDVDGALRLFEDLYRSLGVGRETLETVDPATLQTMLGDRAEPVALILTAEADVLAAAGREAEAKRLLSLAARLVTRP